MKIYGMFFAFLWEYERGYIIEKDIFLIIRIVVRIENYFTAVYEKILCIQQFSLFKHMFQTATFPFV